MSSFINYIFILYIEYVFQDDSWILGKKKIKMFKLNEVSEFYGKFI